MKKYRLKKDTPEFKAGKMFTRGEDAFGNDCLFAIAALLPAFDVSLIDNFDEWFEEVEEPKWIRKQIKLVDFSQASKDILGCKYVDMKYRFIKDYYYYDSKTSFGVVMPFPEREFRFLEQTNVVERTWGLCYFNQLIRDGYIEIEDNPNIVWEDEKCD